MQKKHLKETIRPVHVLAVAFLIFVFYVGMAAFPEFLIQTGECIQDREIGSPYIKKIDEQYSGMLGTNSEYSLLQNKGTYIDFNGLMAKNLGQALMNERVKLKNNHLTRVISETPDPEEIRNAAETIIQFHNAHTATGGNFLFVMAPSQISKYEDLLPVGYTDTSNATADAFLAMLKEAGVPYLDLREELQKEGISITDAYFATDHHWTPQTAFWAFGKIMGKLEQIDAIAPMDPFYTDPDNYTFETYEDTFLGSAGKRTGIPYAGLDDSIFIRPNFDTDISIQIPQRKMQLQGPYEKICYNTDVQHNFEDPNFYQENCYGLYGWGDTEITHWRNEHAPEQSKFLLIGESFGNIPFSLMSICLGSCDEVDLRTFSEDFKDYYDSYRPDTVVLEFNIRYVVSEYTSYPYLN